MVFTFLTFFLILFILFKNITGAEILFKDVDPCLNGITERVHYCRDGSEILCFRLVNLNGVLLVNVHVYLFVIFASYHSKL